MKEKRKEKVLYSNRYASQPQAQRVSCAGRSRSARTASAGTWTTVRLQAECLLEERGLVRMTIPFFHAFTFRQSSTFHYPLFTESTRLASPGSDCAQMRVRRSPLSLCTMDARDSAWLMLQFVAWAVLGSAVQVRARNVWIERNNLCSGSRKAA